MTRHARREKCRHYVLHDHRVLRSSSVLKYDDIQTNGACRLRTPPTGPVAYIITAVHRSLDDRSWMSIVAWRRIEFGANRAFRTSGRDTPMRRMNDGSRG
jgi:hypothetical protein